MEGIIGIDGGELIFGTGIDAGGGGAGISTADFEMVTLGTAVLTLKEPE